MFGPEVERALLIWFAIVVTIAFVGGAAAVEAFRALSAWLGWGGA